MKNPVQGNNAFVQANENKLRNMMGERPGCPPEMHKFNAYMSNDGEKAQVAARKLTKGIDAAFPVK